MLAALSEERISVPNITIRDVAQRANTSPATVSRVINNLGNVTPELCKAVREAIRELNYNPNHAARVLVKQKTNSIGIIVNNLHDPFFTTSCAVSRTARRKQATTSCFAAW